MTQTAHLVIILLLVHPPLAEAEQLRFQWALGTISDGGSIPVAVSQDTSLQSGDRLKAMVRPLSAGYIYLIHQDPSGVFASLITARNDSAAHFAPSEDAWFELDAVTGEERFYILASETPLSDLEALLEAHTANPSAESASQVAANIRALRKQHLKLPKFATKPVTIAGNVRNSRNSSDLLSELAVEVTAERFYGKTITIDHR